jgi:hypothetical protein
MSALDGLDDWLRKRFSVMKAMRGDKSGMSAGTVVVPTPA